MSSVISAYVSINNKMSHGAMRLWNMTDSWYISVPISYLDAMELVTCKPLGSVNAPTVPPIIDRGEFRLFSSRLISFADETVPAGHWKVWKIWHSALNGMTSIAVWSPFFNKQKRNHEFFWGRGGGYILKCTTLATVGTLFFTINGLIFFELLTNIFIT